MILQEAKNIAMAFVSLIVATSCSTTPTGRSQLNLIGDGQMASLGDQSFEQLKKEKPISKDPVQNKLVQCVTYRLLENMGQNPKEWEVLIFVDESPNAFALPGKNVGVHTGMLALVQNQDQLAAVLGHEIGHVLADHGNERMSQGLIAQAGLMAADIVLGENSKKNQMILAALGLGAQYGVLLPYGRKQETEADQLGVEYMAKSGFNPQQSVELWKLMSAKAGGKSPPEFLSTHPSNATRIKELGQLAPRYQKVYEAVPNKPQCGKIP